MVGDARYREPTISSLSTLVMRSSLQAGRPHRVIATYQVRRDGATITDFDFYDLLLKGDKSKDVRLQPGDVLFIPHVGPQAAIAGSANMPAIYELKENSTLNDLVEMAGDLSNVADSSKITIDRFTDRSRKTLEFPFDAQSRSVPLKDGDIVRVSSIIPRFEDTVTLRGHVSNPGRYGELAGMRVRDLIPDAGALLTRRYWRDRAAIVTGRSTEYPVRDEQPRNQQEGMDSSKNDTFNDDGTDAAHRSDFGATSQVPGVAGAASLKPNEQKSSDTQQRSQLSEDNAANPSMARNVAEDVRRYSPEINWDYAIIQRVNPVDLSSKLIWMSPRKAILEHDDASNLELQAGDMLRFSRSGTSVCRRPAALSM